MSGLKFRITILGSGSATPTSQRYPSAQALNVLERFFLIDCSEGAQLRIRQNRISFNRINQIFISHLHGDHFFGLIGLISTMMLLGRKNELHIYAHSELQRYTQFQLDFLDMSDPGFKLVFHPLNFKKPQVIFDDDKLSVTSFPLKHRIACCGFRFDEKPRQPNIIKEQIKKYNIPVKNIREIKEGADFITEDGELIPNAQLVAPCKKPRSYAYCSDTVYSTSIVKTIRDVDVLYHEATFEESHSMTAAKTFHSTGMQAAKIAKLANVGKLLIGHFSGRYKTTDKVLEEARSIFLDTCAVNDNYIIDL